MSVLCVVPTALRATRAARRLCDAQGGVLLGARVTTPDGLAALLLGAAGDPRPLLPPLAERLLALEAGRAAGGPFAALRPGDGLAAALASAIGELRRAEVTADQARAASALAGGERLAPLAAALEAYERRLLALGALDRAAALRAAAGLAPRSRADELRALDLLVLDGFVALPPAGLELVAALAHRAGRTHARAPFFPERADLCGPAEGLVRALEAQHELAARRTVDLVLEPLAGERLPRLAAVLGAVAGGRGAPAEGEGALSARVGAGARGEAEVAARAVAELLDRGYAPEEVLLLAASPGRAAPELARACAAVGVPFAAGRGEALADLAPVGAVRAVLAAAGRPGREALEALSASPYLGLAPPPARLGFWLDRAGALDGRGPAPEEALRARAAALRAPGAGAERAALLRAAGALGAARAALAPLAAPGTPREHAARLRGFLARAGARRRAARAEQAVAARDLAALARVEEVADELARSLTILGAGAAPLAAEDWAALLGLALEEAPAPPAPEPAAGAVELWALSEAPGLAARAAVLVGCERGAFPAPPPPEPLLREAERAALREAGARHLATGARRRAEALHAAFCALAAGREAVVLTWRGAGPEGAGAAPAPLAVEALEAAGTALPAGAEGEPGPAASRGDAEALRALARAARQGAAASAPPALAPRAAAALALGALEAERREAVLARRPSPAAGLVPAALRPALAAALPPEWNPSLLERHALCPYRIFAGVALGLQEPERAELEIDPRDAGSLAHAVLERFVGRRLARGAPALRGEPAEREELRAVAAEVFAEFEASGRTGDPAAWAGRRAAALAQLTRVVAAEAEAMAADGAVPALVEHRFGGDAAAPPLAFPDPEAPGGAVRLKGRLDRVDAAPDHLLLIDYKSGRSGAELKKKLQPEALGVTNFQVPAYLLAAARALPGRARLEATYLLLGAAERLDPLELAGGEPAWAAEFGARVVEAARRIRAGELPIASRDCGGCPYGALCRAEASAEAAP